MTFKKEETKLMKFSSVVASLYFFEWLLRSVPLHKFSEFLLFPKLFKVVLPGY